MPSVAPPLLHGDDEGLSITTEEDQSEFLRFANVKTLALPFLPHNDRKLDPSGHDRERSPIQVYKHLKSVPEPVVVEPKVVSQPKIWSDAPIIEEYKSDSDDEYLRSKQIVQLGAKWETAVKPLSRFSWVFFLRTKDETSGILKDFIRQIENQLNQKVKTIRCDNGTEFKNRDIIEFCGSKGIKREYSNARTPQQNGVAERKNRTLIEAARTMLADSFLPNTFWAEAVSTACYVLNRVLVTKPQNKTPYELITGKIPIISYIRPFGCHVTILNTIDHLGKFEGKSDEGFLVGYSLNSKAFRVYNLETKRVEENLHINFLENKPNVAGKGPNWLFDLDYLTDSMNYQPVRSENQANKTAGPEEANHSAGTQDNIDAGNSEMEADPAQDYFVLPICSSYTSTVKSSEAKNEGKKPNMDTGLKTNEEPVDQEDQAFLEELERLKRQEKQANDAAEALRKEFAQEAEDLLLQAGAARATSTNTVNIVSTPISTASPSNVFSAGGPALNNNDQDDSQIPALEDIYDNPSDGIFTNASYDDEGAVADFTNLESTVNVSPIPTSRIHSIHPTTQILRDPKSAKISEALEDESWVDAMQEELLQFKIQEVWILLDLPYGEKAIGTKWVYKNKKDERGVVVRNKARIQAIRIFLAFASYMGFIVYQMDVKSAFLYGTINEEVYVSQPLGFVDPKFPKKVYKVVKALYSLHQAPRAWYATLSTFLLKSGYRRGTIDKTLFIKKDKNDIIFQYEFLREEPSPSLLGLQDQTEEIGIFISRDKYVVEILKKFNFDSVKTASTPIKTYKPLVKDEEAADVDVHLYRFQVTPKTSHLHDVKRIFRYLKGKPKLGLWYPRESSFDLVAYSESDYGSANLDRKSTTGGCQFLGHRTAVDKYCGYKTRCWTMGQTTTGKESSNPLMADSLPKTIQSNDPPLSRGYKLRSGEDSLELMKLMAYCTNLCEFVKVLVSEASIRRHLKFEDSEGLNSLPNAEMFEQLANMGITSSPSLSPQSHQPSPSPHPIDITHHTKEPTQMPHESPLHNVYSLGCDEGSLSLNELMVLCTSLSEKVASLESELKQTKETYSTALIKLILRVKKLEKQGRIIEEIDADTDITLVTPTKVSSQSVGLTQTYTRRRRNVGTGSGGVSTASESDSTAGGKAKDKGKEIMQEPESPKKLKKRLMLRKNMNMYLKNQGGYKDEYFKESKEKKINEKDEKEETQMLAKTRSKEEDKMIRK
ncbi:putative ribonuclease H-like domain-containing protein [Tanacetum coccineum]